MRYFYPLPLDVGEVCARRRTLRWACSCIYCFLVVIQRHRLRFPSHRAVACGWHIALNASGRPGVKPSPEDSGTQFPLSAPPTKRTGAPSPAASTSPLCPHRHLSLHTRPAFSSSLHGSKPPTGSVGRRPPQGQGSVWGAAGAATPADFGPCRGVGEPGQAACPTALSSAGSHGRGVGDGHPTPRCVPVLGDSQVAPGYSVDELVCLWVRGSSQLVSTAFVVCFSPSLSLVPRPSVPLPLPSLADRSLPPAGGQSFTPPSSAGANPLASGPPAHKTCLPAGAAELLRLVAPRWRSVGPDPASTQT